jgi:diguanylate cyclase (GGDEF)-like protein
VYLVNARRRDEALTLSAKFRHGALHDALTGLPNRLLLQERLAHAAQRAQRSHGRAAILFVDLDDFKAVNDAHGHRVGDALLCAVAVRLTSALRPGDTLARLAGDEFVLLCEDLDATADAYALARRVLAAFATPFHLDVDHGAVRAAGGGVTLSVTASVGMSIADPGEEIGEYHLADADVDMYQAKRRGSRSWGETGRTTRRRQ